MVWVQREQAGALAVVSAWIAALLPWNVTYSTSGGIWVLFVRFPLFEFQYTSGFSAAVDGPSVRTVLGAMQLQSGQDLETATLIWGAGAVVIVAALLLSAVYYTNETVLETGRVHPVRLMGGLLGVATLLFGAATVFVLVGGFGGTPIPIGVLLMGLLAWVLVGADLTDDAERDGGTLS